MMMPLLRAFAAAAGVVVLQHAFSASLASDIARRDSLQLSDTLSDFTERFHKSMASFMNLLSLNPFRTDPSLQEISIALSFPPEDEKSCQLSVVMGSAVHPSGVSVGLKIEDRLLTVSYQKEERSVEHDTDKGDRSASRSVKASSTMGLPERCIVTSAVVDSNLAGYILEKSDAGESRARVVFPSYPLLEELVEAGKLPEDIVGAVERGDNERLARLTGMQQCLAAGFMEAQCERLQGRPKVAPEQPTGADSDSVRIPLYDTGL